MSRPALLQSLQFLQKVFFSLENFFLLFHHRYVLCLERQTSEFEPISMSKQERLYY